jgi:hypothetical protein
VTETPARTPYCHKIRYGITGAPILTEDDMDGSHAPGVGVEPRLIELVYSTARDGKPASVSASVTGWWTRFGRRDEPDDQVTTHFKSGPDGWPYWLAEEARLHDPAAAESAGPAPATDRAALSAKLWAVAEHHIVAEWICCEPLDPKHDLCAKGYAALDMAKTLLVDSDPAEAWNPEAPLLDAVMALLPSCPDPVECGHEAALGEAQQEARRLRLTVDEYGQGASALSWKLKRLRDMHRETCPLATGRVGAGFSCSMCEVLDAPAAPVLPASLDRAAVLRKAADGFDAHAEKLQSGIGDKAVFVAKALQDQAAVWREAGETLRRMAAETPPAEARRCACPHPADGHSMYGCVDGCACEWMPKRQPMDPVHILGIGAPRCDVEFEGGGHCSKPAGHRTPQNQDPHTPAAAPAAVAQPDEEA